MKIKESEIAKLFIKNFDGSGYEIYQEVSSPIGTTDIVLKHDYFTWSIEVKTNFCFKVLEQAFANLKYYNYSSICVPPSRQTKNFNFGIDICKQFGIGVFLQYNNIYNDNLREYLKAKLQRKARTDLVPLLEIQKDFAEAGNAEGKKWTPFAQTIRELEQYVSKNPGCKMRDALNHISHHYASLSSAQNSIRQWIKAGVIDSITNERGKLNLKN